MREACAAVLGALISSNVSKGKVSCGYYIAVEFNLVSHGIVSCVISFFTFHFLQEVG